MWYLLALFYDSGELGPAYATVAMATAVASILGGPVAAGLLMLNGAAGLHGWQARPVCLFWRHNYPLHGSIRLPLGNAAISYTKWHLCRQAGCV